jgi:hypothetical protein
MDEKRRMQAVLNHSLSGLKENPFLAQRVIAQGKGEKPMKKKSVSLILVPVLVCLCVTALAAGIVFSRKADNSVLADREMETRYGVTMTMLGSYFSREDEQAGDATVVRYRGIRDLAYVLGEYTVTVKDGKAEAEWSHDGEDTSGGYEAEAWGTEQMRAMLESDKTKDSADDYYARAAETAKNHGAGREQTGSLSEEDLAEMEAAETGRKADEQAARAAAKLPEDEMIALARRAAMEVYGLTEDQAAAMTCPQDIEEYEYYRMEEGGVPVYDVWFYLSQGSADAAPGTRPAFVEKDGIYMITVNAETGVIESTLYDSGLGANE